MSMSNIETLYRDLENKNDWKTLSLDKYVFETEQEKNIANMERWASFKTFTFIQYPAIQRNQKKIVKYYIDRLDHTKNNFLLARYSHLLYLFTHRENWCDISIKNYKEIITDLSQNPETAYKCKQTLELVFNFWSSQRSKITLDIKPLITELIKKGNDLLKISLIQFVTDQQSQNHKLYKAYESGFIVPQCKELAIRIDDYQKRKNVATAGIYFALKNPKVFKDIIDELYVILGDNEEQNIRSSEGQEENLAIATMNQQTLEKMIEYYQRGHCKEKEEFAMKRYMGNRKNIKYIPIAVSRQRDSNLIKEIEEYFQERAKLSSIDYLVYLIMGDRLVFLPNEYLEKQPETEYFYKKMTKQVIADIKGNERPAGKDLDKFMMYQISVNNGIKWLISTIIEAHKQKTFSYAKTKRFLLKQTFFGISLYANRNNNEITYTWFGQIDFVIKDFFKQLRKLQLGKTPDWRLVIDVLPSKFEGILRDMISLSGGVTTKKKDETTEEITLEALFDTPTFLELFDIDDKNLFEFVFTKKKLNIRNYVAHGMYISQDYSMTKAVLAYLCILRLAKANLRIEKSCICNKEKGLEI